MASGSFPTFILLGWESLALLGLVSGTRLPFFAAALDFGWTGLLAKGVVIICQHLMNSIIFFFNDGWGWITVPQGLHFVICNMLFSLNVCIPFRVWIFRSTSIVSSGRAHFKNPKMRSHQWKPSHALL